MENPCVCGSGLDFYACCGPFIGGLALPRKPVQLMRSRYTAFVMQNIEYLLSTWHPDRHAEQWREEIVRPFPFTEWKSLTIISETAGKNNHEQFVEFIAAFFDTRTRRPGFVHERSRFVQLHERWYYIDGIHQQPQRNALCPCGSGKKYKKCCGQ